MEAKLLKTPVAFMIFNRPETTARVFEAIRQARPRKLLVVADGPRPGRQEEAVKCEQARAIISQVNWPCDVMTNFSEVNLGCKRRISSGLDWVFSTVEEAIVLEDDCLPHPSFFRFCEELLERYRDDDRIMMISGDNFQFENKRTEYSYYFSYHTHIWGWASWRRAWQYYDVDMKLWPLISAGNWLDDFKIDMKMLRRWKDIYDKVYAGKIDTWDYQWTFACWVNNGLVVLPNHNLVANIGFGHDATHIVEDSILSNLPSEAMSFPLVHPPFLLRDTRADAYTDRMMFSRKLSIRKIINKIRKMVNIALL